MPVSSRMARALGAGLVGALTLLNPAAAAWATPPPTVSPPIVDGLAGPLQIDVGRGNVLVGQSFSGVISTVSTRPPTVGAVTDLPIEPGVDGVAWGPGGSVLFTRTDFDTGSAELRSFNGRTTRTVADLGAFETAYNPDQVNTYGFQGLSDECLASLPPDPSFPPYQGLLDSHPYAIAVTGQGTLVADAGGNDILLVDRNGGVHLVAVLPPQPITVTAELAAAMELPSCVAGSPYRFEPVPTDIEIGRDGMLYVTTLPGGPEDPSLGARGSVYRIDPRTGTSTRVATGFLGAANLAIGPDGTIYVAELFGDRITAVTRRGRGPIGQYVLASVPSPAALEWSKGRLYVGSDVFGSGKLLTVDPRPGRS